MKKVSFSVFALLFCLLFVNTQPQFAAVFSEGKVKTFAKKRTGEKNPSRTNVKKQTALWQQVSEDLLKSETHGLPDPEKYLVFRLNKTALTEILADVPSELNKALPEKSVIMELPMPDGSFTRFRIEASSVLEPDFAARFPEIKSYRGQGIDDPTLTTRFDWTPQGFHAMILASGQPINLEPANAGDSSLYISYYGDDMKKGEYSCLVKDFQKIETGLPQTDAPQIAVGSTLRNFRIAIATTYEYAQAYGGGTVAGTVSSLNTWLNGANLIYERELSIHLNLVNSTSVIYSADRDFTSATDPYNNSNVGSMLSQAVNDIYGKVGSANYDIGHVMGYLNGGASGVSYVGVACSDGLKGGGATLMGGQAGNSSALGVWVHELGHQFGADHNYNGTQGFCGGSRSDSMSYETGSGSTIMGYPGICGSDDILYYRDMRFHAMSYAAINNYLNSYGSCSIKTATSNLPPTISGGGDRNVPKNTPFTLTATASDANGDSLSYNWEQIDAGGANYPQNGTSASYNDANDPSTTTRPIFRPYQSVDSPSRTFPNLYYILNYDNDPPDTDSSGQQTADELPRIARTLNFRVTARDNRTGGGGVNEDTVRVTVDNSGPFLVTSPNTGVNLSGGTTQTVTWSVNNTNIAPVNAANVKISLSTDGGLTFPTVLAANTANDGSESVLIPNITTTTARIKVEAVGNIFFDISNTNFSISAGTGGGSLFNIGGVITYGITQAGQTTKFVSGVNLTATGTSTLSAVTNSLGNYQLTGLTGGGNYTVTPSKSGGIGQPFSTVDASRVLQAIVGLTTLTPQQLAAADSDSTGDLSTVDASNILRAIVGLPNTGSVGQWKFLPASRPYPVLNANQSNQNYEAVVVGDVDGDWVSGGSSNSMLESNAVELFSKQSGKSFVNQSSEKPSAPAAVTVSLPTNAGAGSGTTVTIPITVGDTTGQNVRGFNFVLTFNSNVIQPLADDAAITQLGTLSAGFFCVVNTTTANQLSVACSGSTPISGTGTLLNLNFIVVGAAGNSTPLTFTTFRFGSGTPTVTVTNGNFTVAAPSAASVSIGGRLDNGKGRGVANAQVIITNSRGETRVARSNAFGYFKFADVPAGETYIFTVKSKQYGFSAQVVNVTQDLTNLILTAQSRQ